MKTITLFETSWCPYCKLARKLIDDLKLENPDYQNIPVDFIDEELHPEISMQYDYYYVPTLYINKNKLHEGIPTKEIIKNIFDSAINS
jgi:thioredoxin 1